MFVYIYVCVCWISSRTIHPPNSSCVFDSCTLPPGCKCYRQCFVCMWICPRNWSALLCVMCVCTWIILLNFHRNCYASACYYYEGRWCKSVCLCMNISHIYNVKHKLMHHTYTYTHICTPRIHVYLHTCTYTLRRVHDLSTGIKHTARVRGVNSSRTYPTNTYIYIHKHTHAHINILCTNH